MRWALVDSLGSAKIFFENEHDPVTAAERLNDRRIDTRRVSAQVDKKNSKVVYVSGLSQATDEDDIIGELDLKELLGDP